MSWIKLTWKRLMSKTPLYFKKIRTFFQKVLIVATAALGVQSLPGINLPEKTWVVISAVMLFSTIVITFCSLPTDDNELSKK